jgi:hypothetical protein
VLGFITGEVYGEEGKQDVFPLEAFTMIVVGIKFDIEVDDLTREFIARVSGHWYWACGPCCTPCLIENWRDDDGNPFEEVLFAIFDARGIVSNDVVPSNIDVQFASVLPCFLQEPSTNFVLLHKVNYVLQFE